MKLGLGAEDFAHLIAVFAEDQVGLLVTSLYVRLVEGLSAASGFAVVRNFY